MDDRLPETLGPAGSDVRDRTLKAQAATIATQQERILNLEGQLAHYRALEWRLFRRHIHWLKQSWVAKFVPHALRLRLKQFLLKLLRR